MAAHVPLVPPIWAHFAGKWLMGWTTESSYTAAGAEGTTAGQMDPVHLKTTWMLFLVQGKKQTWEHQAWQNKTLQFSLSGVSFYHNLSKSNVAKWEVESQCIFMTFVTFPDVKFTKLNNPKQEAASIFLTFLQHYYLKTYSWKVN